MKGAVCAMPFVCADRADRLPPTASVVDGVFANLGLGEETGPSGASRWKRAGKTLMMRNPHKPASSIFTAPRYVPVPRAIRPKRLGLNGVTNRQRYKDYHVHRGGYNVPQDVFLGRGELQLARYFAAAIMAEIAKDTTGLEAEQVSKMKSLQVHFADDAEGMRRMLGSWHEPWMLIHIGKCASEKKWQTFYKKLIMEGVKYLIEKQTTVKQIVNKTWDS